MNNKRFRDYKFYSLSWEDSLQMYLTGEIVVGEITVKLPLNKNVRYLSHMKPTGKNPLTKTRKFLNMLSHTVELLINWLFSEVNFFLNKLPNNLNLSKIHVLLHLS